MEKLELLSYDLPEEEGEIPPEEENSRKRPRENSVTWRKFESNKELPESLVNKIKSSLASKLKCENRQLISTFVVNILQVICERDGKRQSIRIIRICR